MSDRGLLGRAEKALNAPAAGTPLRPYITKVRQSVTGAASSVSASVDGIVGQVDSAVGEGLKKVDSVLTLENESAGEGAENRGTSVPTFKMLRPEIKLGCIVGATALLSARFGARSFVRNTVVMSAVGGWVAYPEFWDRAVGSFQDQVEKLAGSKR